LGALSGGRVFITQQAALSLREAILIAVKFDCFKFSKAKSKKHKTTQCCLFVCFQNLQHLKHPNNKQTDSIQLFSCSIWSSIICTSRKCHIGLPIATGVKNVWMYCCFIVLTF
jgi:hypothetical protein